MTARAEDFAVYDEIKRTAETCLEVQRLQRNKQRAAARQVKAGVSPEQPGCLGKAVALKCRNLDFPVCRESQPTESPAESE